jgi:hypothetical protein
MTVADVLSEIDKSIMQTRRAVVYGQLPNDDYTAGIIDGLCGMRRFLRSDKFIDHEFVMCFKKETPKK